MGFGARPGITKLSELTIDTSKDWLLYRIRNLLDPTLDQDAATKAYHDDNPGGITKLSELEIDTSKDWLGYLVKNIGDAVDPQDAVAYHQVEDCLDTLERWIRYDHNRVISEIIDGVESIIDYKLEPAKVGIEIRLSIPLTFAVVDTAALYTGEREDLVPSIPVPAIAVVAELT